MNLAPICLFAYNRFFETKQTVKALQKNFLAAESDLYVYSDGAKTGSEESVEKVRNLLKSITGFKSVTIYESGENLGLASSIISGVSNVLAKRGKVIVLEDDLITSPNFLTFMNQALTYFKDNKNVQSINGYSLPVKNMTNDFYVQIRPFSWGWGTWKECWNDEIFNKERIKSELECHPEFLKEFGQLCGADTPRMLKDSIYDRNNSWYIRWVYDHYRNRSNSVYPAKSLVENVGFNNNGTHCNGIGAYNFPMLPSKKTFFNFRGSLNEDPVVTEEYLYHFTLLRKLEVRLQHLKSSKGRKLLWQEAKQRIM